MARQVCELAERYRKTLAVEWLGQELPEWQDVCPIQVMVGPHLGAGGATSFTFINGQPRDWHMEIQGSQARVLDSVLPHEITHMVLATHFGRPLPRWADEGAATSVEHLSERSKQEKLLIQFLMTDRGIAFNHMFAMKEYPRDILPLYSQGYSLARYLIARGGKRAFIDYVGDGLNWNNWTAATQKHYGIQSLSDLQLTWLDWVKKGSPDAAAPVALAAHTQPASNPSQADPPTDRSMLGVSGLVPLPSPVTPRGGDVATATAVDSPRATLAKGPQHGWYSRQRNESLNRPDGSAAAAPPSPISPIVTPEGTQQLGRPQSPQSPGQIILEWSRSDHQQTAGAGTMLR